MTRHLPSSTRPLLSLRAAAITIASGAILLSSCTLDIKKPWPDGVDPCDPNPCTAKGACANWTGSCAVSADGKAYTCSEWKPDGEAPKGADGKPLTEPLGFEAAETQCDGVDNDCDGQTDEGLVGNPLTDCNGKGVCAGAVVHLGCIGGAWKCDWSVLAAFEASETTCDGKDNDCDGETDETVSPGAQDCRRAGVCAGLAPAKCSAGKWDCGYGAALSYEAKEATCDGLDNDCDGKIDVGLALSSLPDGGSCPATGVCAGGVAVVCVGGKPACDPTAVVGFEALEGTCDGKDNDCDGKTDNLQGTDVGLTDKDVSSCKSAGVCQVAKTSIVRTCTAGAWACNYDAVPYFEAKESLCDARDNDCDGLADSALPAPKTSPCPDKGLCATAKSTCKEGLWHCDYAALAAVGYQAFETQCDGVDNDCDGETDETTSPKTHKCADKGVCQVGTSVTCTAGKATCNYDAVPWFEAVSETSCDGKDNDCDGLVDEGGLDDSAAGCSKGVCKDAAVAVCTAGAWKCDVSKVTGYQTQEAACDGKDNDCDGETDEAEHLDLSATQCGLSLGVCATDKKLACTAGKATCSYGGDYEQKESKCDGKDNDCDGQTDLGLCAARKACEADGWCDKGSCAEVRGGSGKLCTDKFGQCAQADDKGQVLFTDNTGGLCASSTALLTCSSGAWSAAKTCPKDTPACFEGKCQVCIPAAKSCDADNVGDVLQCDAGGTKTTKLKTCATGKCVGAGLCVAKGTFDVSDTTKAITAMTAVGLANAGFAGVWISKEPFGNTVKGRAFDGEGAAVAKSFDVSDTSNYASATSRVAAASNGARYAVAWTAGADAHVAVLDAAHKSVGKLKLTANNTSDASGVGIGTFGTGWIVVWSAIDGNLNKIYAQRLDTNGKAVGDVVPVVNDSPQRYDSNPVVAETPAGGFTVVWASVDDGGNFNPQITGRTYDKDGKSLTASTSLRQGNDALTTPAVAYVGSTLVVAWTVASAGGDVEVATFSDTFVAKAKAVAASDNTTGAQGAPSLAVDASGNLVLAFSTTDLGASTGADVAVRHFDTALTFTAKESLAGDGKGLQDGAAPIAFADGRLLVLWRHRADSNALGKVVAEFR